MRTYTNTTKSTPRRLLADGVRERREQRFKRETTALRPGSVIGGAPSYMRATLLTTSSESTESDYFQQR